MRRSGRRMTAAMAATKKCPRRREGRMAFRGTATEGTRMVSFGEAGPSGRRGRGTGGGRAPGCGFLGDRLLVRGHVWWEWGGGF